jgi:NADH-quinone oxidoreductase subunit N
MIDFNLIPLLPELFLALSAMGLLMVGAFHGHSVSKVLSWFGVGTCFIALIIVMRIDWSGVLVLNQMFALSPFAAVMKMFILLGLMASLALSVRYLIEENMARFEYPVLVLFAGIGMLLMVSAENMLSLYMALELQSLSLYVLAAFRRTGLRSSEAGVKYFSLGALSSGMLLFGISLIYGASGALDFASIGVVASSADVPMGMIVGMVFILAGLAFKISAVPFHMWTPDVYQGAPSSVTALFAIVPKLAAMGLLIKLLFGPFYGLAIEWTQVIYVLSIGSMIVGAFAGLAQQNIKRLLAYSSIGNMGYALIGIVAASPDGVSAVMLYLVTYMFMTAGVFAIVMSMRRGDLMVLQIKDLAGLSKSKPVLAYAMAILMFSMSGIPPLAGFFGKLVVFQAAISAELYILAVLGVLTSVVAAFYYLRIIKTMFFDELDDMLNDNIPLARHVVLGVSMAFIVLFVFKPSGLMELFDAAVQNLFLV